MFASFLAFLILPYFNIFYLVSIDCCQVFFHCSTVSVDFRVMFLRHPFIHSPMACLIFRISIFLASLILWGCLSV